MKPTSIIQRLVILLITLMCALGANAAEAYACYTWWDTTLTFYYDNLQDTRMTTTYDLNTGENNPGWYEDDTKSKVTQVVFDSSIFYARPTSTYRWFYGMHDLQSITGLHFLNTSEVTTMRQMFAECPCLTTIDVTHFNTSKVTDMSWMFSNCWEVKSIDVSSFYTANVTNMYGMFDNCRAVQTIYVSEGWSTANVTTSKMMFFNCPNLVGGQGTTCNSSHMEADYAHIDGGPSNPGYFTDRYPPEAYACYTSSNRTLTFYYDAERGTRSGTTYDLNTDTDVPGWDSDNTKSYVTKVVFDPSFANARPTSTRYWFFYMKNLQSIKGLNYLNTSEVTTMENMFNGCTSLTSLDLSSFNTSKVTNMDGLFWECSSLPSIDVSRFNTSNVTSMASMFNKCINLKSLDLSNFNTSKVTAMHVMFSSCEKLTTLDLTSFNTSRVLSMRAMFEGCTNLQTIYVGSGWNLAAALDGTNMFNNCTSLVGGMGTTYNNSNPNDLTYAHIDRGTSGPGYFSERKEAYACYTPSNTTLTFYYDTQRSSRSGIIYDLNVGENKPDWYTDGTNKNVTKVVFNSSFANARPTTTFHWFYYMQNLQSITGMSYLNTSEVSNMACMFSGCKKLSSIDLSHFNTAKVTDMNLMFGDCSNLINLDLGSFNTTRVTDMNMMFYSCSGLTSLDLSSFNTSKVIHMDGMFYFNSNLRTIYVGNGWSTAAVTSSLIMFTDCTSLIGGKGTTFDYNHADKTYAHIDGGTSNPGYFTARNIGIATDLHQATSDKQQVQSDEWYTIDGRKLNGMPAKKGVYIQNGKKTIVH